MLSDSLIIGFLPTRDASTSRPFFETTLGLQFVSDDGFALVFRAGANMIRVVRSGDFKPQPYTVLGWEVSDLTKTVRELCGAGVTFERYSFVEQDVDAIWTTPAGDRVAWFRDPDGNTLSLSQHTQAGR